MALTSAMTPSTAQATAVTIAATAATAVAVTTTTAGFIRQSRVLCG